MDKLNLSELVTLVLNEVERASLKNPEWPTDPVHAVTMLSEEVEELGESIVETFYEPHKSNKGDVKRRAVQAAAMAIRFLRNLEGYQYSKGRNIGQ